MGTVAKTKAGAGSGISTGGKQAIVTTWANKPAISTLVPYTDKVMIRDVGVGGSEWYSDGTRYRAVGGEVVLFSGSTGASIDVATTSKLINIPIKAGVIGVKDKLSLVSFIKKTGTTGTHGYDFRVSNADDTSATSTTSAVNSFILNSILATNTNVTVGQEVKFLSDTNVYLSGVGAGSTTGFGSGTTAHEQIASSGTFLSQQVYVGIRVNQINAADRVNLLDFTIVLKTCGQLDLYE